MLNDPILSKKFLFLTKTEKDWVLDYLSSGKGTIPISFSGCDHRDKSKCFIALPTDAEYVRVFEKTLIGGFSFVNRRLAFDADILLNDNNKEKVIFDLDINGKKQTKCISSKILKMDENNQYGMAMTKPLPYDCIKKKIILQVLLNLIK